MVQTTWRDRLLTTTIVCNGVRIDLAQHAAALTRFWAHVDRVHARRGSHGAEAFLRRLLAQICPYIAGDGVLRRMPSPETFARFQVVKRELLGRGCTLVLREFAGLADTPPAASARVLPFTRDQPPRHGAVRDIVSDSLDLLLDVSQRAQTTARTARAFTGDYKVYLSSRGWHAFAATVKRAWGYACAINAEHAGAIEVHHRTYARIGHERLSDCVPLCSDCHERFHELLPRQRALRFDEAA